MNVTFFSVSQMHYGWSYCIPHKHFSFISKSLAITSIILITIFTITRLCLYRIGGINCLKRVALAIILAIIPRHNAEMGLLAVEVVYALIRICTEGAHTNALLAVIYCEEILIIVCYIVMTYHNVQILTITVLTIVVVTAICALIYGLSEIMYRTCAKMMLLPKGLMIESAAKESPMDTERLIRPPRSDNNQWYTIDPNNHFFFGGGSSFWMYSTNTWSVRRICTGNVAIISELKDTVLSV